MTNAREVAQLTETLKQKVQALEGMKKGKPSIVRVRCLRKTLKDFTEPGHEKYRGQRTSLYGRSRDLLEVTMGSRSTA